MTWDEQFLELFRRCVANYRGGDSNFSGYFSEEDLKFLESIGYKPRELFDFVEDLVDESTPAESAALLVAAVRRDYLMAVQKGKRSDREVTGNDIPSREDELEGISYLPRIIAKARAKLRGELHPDLMFSCGGDRGFLSEHGQIHPADFLRQVWAAGDECARIASYVRQSEKAD
jgi:hypothetical protein